MSAQLGDARRTQRLLAIVERLAPAPSTSFPMACRGAAELEGCYRLLSNPNVEWAQVLAPHLEQTLARCQAAAAQGQPLVVAHDTTGVRFSGSEQGVRTGLGTLNRGESGFEAHLALACSLPAPQQVLAHPLGVVGLHPHVRPPRPKRTHAQQKKQSHQRPRASASRKCGRSWRTPCSNGAPRPVSLTWCMSWTRKPTASASSTS